MKTAIALVTLACVSLSSYSRFLQSTYPVDPTTTAHNGGSDYQLRCGQCIRRGFKYCTNVANPPDLSTNTNGEPSPCRPAAETALENSNFYCTSSYANRAYSYLACQYNTASCSIASKDGTAISTYPASRVITLADDAAPTITVTNLAAGATCYYYFKTADDSCQAPQFEVPSDSTADKLNYEITWIQHYSDVISKETAITDNTVKTKASADLFAYPPFAGFPARGQNFENSEGKQAIMMPARGGGTDAAGISGRYDAEAKGVQAFMEMQGTDGSSAASEEEKCQARYLHLAVTNTQASAALASLKVNLSMMDVTVPETTSAFWSLSALASMLVLAVATLV